MKNKTLIIIILILTSTHTLLKAEQTNLTDILRFIERNLAPKNFIGEYNFKNLRSDGTISEYRIRIQGRDADTVHLYFLEPAREKGREMLRYDDSIWTYIPSVGRVVRVEDRESFAGGDFFRRLFAKELPNLCRVLVHKLLRLELNIELGKCPLGESARSEIAP